MSVRNDTDSMLWGQYRGRRLSDVPDDYWNWCLDQEWFRDQRDLYEYACTRVYTPDGFEDAVRRFRRGTSRHVSRPQIISDSIEDPYANA
jgi:uncharacterized protein (DUF3820 family)